jgi:hypothetical protein
MPSVHLNDVMQVFSPDHIKPGVHPIPSVVVSSDMCLLKQTDGARQLCMIEADLCRFVYAEERSALSYFGPQASEPYTLRGHPKSPINAY